MPSRVAGIGAFPHALRKIAARHALDRIARTAQLREPRRCFNTEIVGVRLVEESKNGPLVDAAAFLVIVWKRREISGRPITGSLVGASRPGVRKIPNTSTREVGP